MIELLRELNFTTVVCIDDENAAERIESIDVLAREFANAKPRKRRNLANLDAFFMEPLRIAEVEGADPQSIQSDVRAWLERQDEDELSGDRLKLASETLRQGVVGPTAKKVRNELHEAGFMVYALSFGQWLQRKNELLKGAKEGSKILLLVDEVNDNERDVDLDGERLLADLLIRHREKVPFVDAIVVTSRCQPNQELAESQKVYEAVSDLLAKSQAPRSFKKVFVLSKTRLVDSTFADSFRLHLNRLEASRLSIALADATKLILIGALEESLDWLKSIPLIEFHHSVFVSAATEGAAEVDTLVRLASIRQRTALDKLLRENTAVQGYIEAMRKFTPDGLGGVLASATSIMLKQLRAEEFERPGTHINLLRIPLACGDVFKFKTAGPGAEGIELEAMLLVNPCDLVLRSDGGRKLRTGLLVPVRRLSRAEAETAVQADIGSSPLLYRLSTGSDGDDITYLFNNSKIESIPLSVLDLCWLNADGSALLERTAVETNLANLSAPQRARVSHLGKRAEEGRFTDVELWGADLRVKTEIATAHEPPIPASMPDRVEYQIQRKWRMAPEFAAAALSALSHALSRPTFGHDYLQH